MSLWLGIDPATNTFFFDKSLALIASLHAISFNFLNSSPTLFSINLNFLQLKVFVTITSEPALIYDR